MAATAGYLTQVFINGTATTMTGEACTKISSGPPEVWRISSATKRVIDPDTPVVIQNEDTDDVTSDFTIDYLSGTLTSQTGGYAQVTVSGKYLPRLQVAEGRSANVNMQRAELDTSVEGESYTKVVLGKKSATGEIVTLAPLDEDLDSGGTTRTWAEVLDGAGEVMIDTVLTPTSTVRAWARTPSQMTKSDQAGLVENTITWTSMDKRATDGTECGVSVFDPT